ncbi:MAG: nitrate/nitrite transporter, partial [Klebsiella grimontii]|nr:nitrate/nitrite transporter [Klebsiella grimontii]
MSHSSIPEKTTSSVISDWRPEDPEFWQQRGHRVASRNLWISVPCLLLAFCVWMLFSAVAVNLNKVGFQFTTDQLFMLTAL